MYFSNKTLRVFAKTDIDVKNKLKTSLNKYFSMKSNKKNALKILLNNPR